MKASSEFVFIILHHMMIAAFEDSKPIARDKLAIWVAQVSNINSHDLFYNRRGGISLKTLNCLVYAEEPWRLATFVSTFSIM